MKIERLRNTVTQMPDREVKPGELIENVQICPVGDYPNGGKNQHCTLEALQNVAADWERNGKKEILVDFEHNSESTDPNNDTSAAAWVSNVRVDPSRGLVGDFKMTDVGAEAVSNRRLRFLSVSWFVNKETREPIRITSIALTNKPNIPVEPVLNKEGEVEEIENVLDANGLSHGEDGKFDGGNGSAGGKGGKGKSEKSTDSFKRRMDEEGEVTELNDLELKFSKLRGDDPFNLSPEAEKALSDLYKKKADLQKRGIIDERIRGAKPGEGFKHKSTTDEMKRRTPVNMGDGRSSWSEEERKRFSDPTSHLKLGKIPNKQERNNMDKIKEALGLAPEATEEDVLNAINAMVKENKDAKQAALDKEAEAYAEKNKAKLDPAVIKAQYVANKAACMALVDAIPEKTPAAKQQMLNKAKEPGKAADVVKELNKCKTPAERIAFAEAHAAEFAE